MTGLLATVLPVRAWLLALVAGFVLAASLVSWFTITHAEARAAAADAARLNALAQVSTLSASLERQNEAIQAAGEAYAAKVLASEQAAAAARKAMAAANARAAALKREAVPADCAGASAWSVKRAAEIGSRWNAGGTQ